jgi:hypothetical protein
VIATRAKTGRTALETCPGLRNTGHMPNHQAGLRFMHIVAGFRLFNTLVQR